MKLKQRTVFMYFVMHSEITFCELNEWTGFFYRNVQKVSENVKPARGLVFWLSATALLFRFCIYYVNKCCMKFEYFSFARMSRGQNSWLSLNAAINSSLVYFSRRKSKWRWNVIVLFNSEYFKTRFQTEKFLWCGPFPASSWI